MKQWKNTKTSDNRVEVQSREDILAKIKSLAESYVPEWQFSENDPDIGSVIALLYADEEEENSRRYHTLLERDYVELMNMLGVSLRPAYPAHSIVLLQLSQDTIPGFKLKKGMKLLGNGGDAGLVFETAHSIYVTESRLRCAFMASGKDGKVIPLFGKFPPISYVKGAADRKDEDGNPENGEEDTAEVPASSVCPFRLFDFRGEGYGKYGLLFAHPYLFDVQDNDILMEIASAPDFVRKIGEGKYRLSYYGETGFEPVTDLRQESESCLAFRKTGKCRKVTEQGRECSLLLLEPEEIPEESLLVERIGFSSEGAGRAPEHLWNGITELTPDFCKPFGETISQYAELYIGQEDYFSKTGARLTVRFQLDFATHLIRISISRQQEETELKVIKRKPKKETEGAPAEVFADEISLSYFNGTGWRRLETETPMLQMFSSPVAGSCEFSFICPKDWQPVEVGGFFGRSLRLQVTRADNCYYQPALHHYPVIRDMEISYSYRGRFACPLSLTSFQGSRRRELTEALAKDPMTPVFCSSQYQENALYLGFDQKMEDGPVSLLIQVQETEGYPSGKLAFSYSTREGFSRLKLSDHTDGLSHTGTLFFMPPPDMAKRTMEGQEAYWIRITEDKKDPEENPAKRPVITGIHVNAAEVDNIDTLAEEAYYIDVFGPNMEFALNGQNILSLDLWVNETGQFSESEMRRMLTEDPLHTRAEYSFLGEIEEFYVKWEEVDNFDRSLPGDRHYVVDRMNSRLRFGDGVHVQIPRNTKGTAFLVVTHRCDGEAANIEPGAISDSLGGLLFVERIYNPISSYGGMNMETVEEALRRGTGLLNARNRLVSAQDYEKEALNFSAQIAQAKVIVGRRKDGTFSPGAVTMVLLMQDYRDGEQSFLRTRKRLREHLQEKCELTALGGELQIVQPVFAEISVEAWVQVLHADDAFKIQQDFRRVLEEYLDPVGGTGWEIGRMVKKAQLELRLNMEKGQALLQRLLVTAGYRDESGFHEKDIEALEDNPYVLVTSGTHKIHFEQADQVQNR